MHIDQLKYLIEISNNPSINEASKKLHISYQALSHAIKTLENELNLPLLKRTNKGSILTKEGLELVALSKHFIGRIAAMQAEHNVDSQQINGIVNFITSDVCLEYILFDLMNMLKKSYPHIDFHYQTGNYSQTEAYSLLHGNPNCFQICFFGFLDLSNDYPSDIHSTVLYPSSIICQCSYLHELAQYQSVSKKCLTKCNLLLRSQNVFQSLSTDFFEASHIFVEPNPILFERKIASGDYFALAYKVPFAPYWIPPIANTKKVMINTDKFIMLKMFYHDNFILNPQTEIFLNALLKKIGSDKKIASLGIVKNA